MKIRGAFCALALSLFACEVAAGQQLESGTWTGKVIVPVPNAPEMALTFDVRNEGDSLAITLDFVVAPMPFRLENIKVAGNRLTFSFAPPNTVFRCELALQEDRSWAGDCVEDDDPMKVRMVMTPPKKSGGG